MNNWSLLAAFYAKNTEWIFTSPTNATYLKIDILGKPLDVNTPIGLIADGAIFNDGSIIISQPNIINYYDISQIININFTPVFGQSNRRIAFRQTGEFSTKNPCFVRVYTTLE